MAQKNILHRPESKIIKINPYFKRKVSIFRRYLYKVKSECDKFDIVLKNTSDDQHIIDEKTANFIDDASEKVFPKLDNHFVEMWEILKKEFHFEEIPLKDNSVYKVHKEYYQRQIKDFFIGCIFLQQVFYKPLGYAGDYRMMNYLYDSQSPSAGIFYKLIDKYTMNIPISRSVRGRIDYLINKLTHLINKGKRDFFSVACGSAPELLYIAAERLPHEVNYSLLDVDKEAIKFIKGRSLENKNDKLNYKFFNYNVVELLKSGFCPDKQDIIYSIGLFDYLSDKLFVRVAKRLYRFLREEGMLLIGNVSPVNPSRAYMSLIGEWHIIHRTEDQLADLSKQCGFADYSIEKDETGVQLYLVVKK